VDVLGNFVLMVGKLFGTASCTIFALFLLHTLHREISVVTVAFVIVSSFSVFSLFANILGCAVDTLMVCYLEDIERNSGKNLYIDDNLHQMLQERAKETKA